MVTAAAKNNGDVPGDDDERREEEGEEEEEEEEEEPAAEEVDEGGDEAQRPETEASEDDGEGSQTKDGEAALTPSPSAPRKVCLVHRPWMQNWWRYCSIGTCRSRPLARAFESLALTFCVDSADYLEDIDRLVERPGPVSNEQLFDQTGKLLPNLELDVHYSAVAPEVFEAFVQLYGSGPEIVRFSFDIYSRGPADGGEKAARAAPTVTA